MRDLVGELAREVGFPEGILLERLEGLKIALIEASAEANIDEDFGGHGVGGGSLLEQGQTVVRCKHSFHQVVTVKCAKCGREEGVA